MGAALLAAVVAGTIYTGARAGAQQPPSYRTVAPGETLWSIAAEHYPHSEDPRVKIEAIREANGLEGYKIYRGERLELPSAST